MYRVSTILFFSALLFSTELYGQDQKIGFIDSDALMEQMPEYAGIEQRLELLSESWRDEVNELDREIGRLQDEFEAREVLYTDEMREARLSEIHSRQERRDRFIHEKFGPDGEYFQRQGELLEPIQRQVFDAVYRVADQLGFDFVFDRSEDVRFLFARSEWNLTEEVLLELGLEADALRN